MGEGKRGRDAGPTSQSIPPPVPLPRLRERPVRHEDLGAEHDAGDTPYASASSSRQLRARVGEAGSARQARPPLDLGEEEGRAGRKGVTTSEKPPLLPSHHLTSMSGGRAERKTSALYSERGAGGAKSRSGCLLLASASLPSIPPHRRRGLPSLTRGGRPTAST